MSGRKFWADGRDVLEGEHEADTGLIACATSRENARMIASALNLAFDVLERAKLEGYRPPNKTEQEP